jgi:hypothetical protein
MQTKARTKLGKEFLGVLYFFFVFITAIASLLLLFINGKEIIDRSLGHDTELSQMSWLTDKQAIWYSFAWTVILLTGLIMLVNKVYREKHRTVIIICVSLWGLLTAQIFLESLIFYRLV